MAVGPTTRRPPLTSGWVTRPPCITCITIRPPRACTASRAPVGVGGGPRAAVHPLHHDPPAAGVHRLGDAAPALDLLVGDDPGLADERLRLVVRVRTLGDDQADAGALPVVLDDEVTG